MSGLEVLAVVLTVAAVYLTTRQVIWCWPLSMASVLVYALVFFEARLYAEVGLQSFYFALSVYGWWAWRRGGDGGSALAVSSVGRRRGLAIMLGAGVGGLLLGSLLSRFTAASVPYLDSMLAAYSIAAQWLQTRKWIETWLLWIAVDVVYVGMFAYKQLYLTAALYAAFLYLAALGYQRWRHDTAAEPALETA